MSDDDDELSGSNLFDPQSIYDVVASMIEPSSGVKAHITFDSGVDPNHLYERLGEIMKPQLLGGEKNYSTDFVAREVQKVANRVSPQLLFRESHAAVKWSSSRANEPNHVYSYCSTRLYKGVAYVDPASPFGKNRLKASFKGIVGYLKEEVTVERFLIIVKELRSAVVPRANVTTSERKSNTNLKEEELVSRRKDDGLPPQDDDDLNMDIEKDTDSSSSSSSSSSTATTTTASLATATATTTTTTTTTTNNYSNTSNTNTNHTSASSSAASSISTLSADEAQTNTILRQLGIQRSIPPISTMSYSQLFSSPLIPNTMKFFKYCATAAPPTANNDILFSLTFADHLRALLCNKEKVEEVAEFMAMSHVMERLQVLEGKNELHIKVDGDDEDDDDEDDCAGEIMKLIGAVRKKKGGG
jgi:hypothetical protein